MTLKNHKNHYNVKFLKGYGQSGFLKDNKIILKNGLNPFSDQQEQEEWFVSNAIRKNRHFWQKEDTRRTR